MNENEEMQKTCDLKPPLLTIPQQRELVLRITDTAAMTGYKAFRHACF